MATVTAISTKGGGGGKKSLEYICRDDKTEGKKYVTALYCSLPTAYQEFKNTREMYGKTDGEVLSLRSVAPKRLQDRACTYS